MSSLPFTSHPNLILTHPTPLENHLTHRLSSVSWAGALSKDQYIENEHQLSSHLLRKSNGITHWILTEKDRPENGRPILASCETIPKRCFVKRDGVVKEVIVYGVAGVFCDPQMRGRGYARTMMKELALVLREVDVDAEVESVGSVLWSDIGPKFYANLGWVSFPSTHIELPAFQYSLASKPVVRFILSENVEQFCADDEAQLRSSMATRETEETILALLPDHHTMLWHHKKEEYICQRLFGKQPRVKGAVVGDEGDRVWVIWTRSFYGAVDDPEAENKLYILRLVIENPSKEEFEAQVEKVKAVLQAAQDAAVEWKLGHVELWNPDDQVKELIVRTGIEHRIVERGKEGIPSLLWFGEGGENQNGIEWIANEKYAWC
jgi:hypothetical protein